MSLTLLEFSAQCCDADEYLQYGWTCAETGECYNKLRPMGSVYWFSIPYRLGFQAESLIIGHYLLALLSICLSAVAANKLILISNSSIIETRKLKAILFAASTLVHGIFLYPVFWNSLSDLPASILFLTGIWLLIIASTNNKNMIFIFAAGISFGLSAWIRVFFLYPVILLIIAIAIISWIKKEKRFLLFGVAAIPIVIQFIAVYQKTGEISYIDQKKSMDVKKIHMALDATGYDTLLEPVNSWSKPKAKMWRSWCDNYLPPSEMIKSLDFYSLTCLLTGKINFYLGSYGDRTYYRYGLNVVKHIDLLQTTKHSQDACTNINFVTSASQQPKPTRYYVLPEKIEAALVSKQNTDQSSEAYCETWLEGGYFYSIAAWVWSDPDSNNIIEFFIREKKSGEIVSTSTTIVSPYPNLADAMGKIKESGIYEVGIKSPIYAPGTTIGDAILASGKTVNAGAFYAWDPQIVRDKQDPWNPVMPDEKDLPKRVWSITLLLLNTAALLAALWMIYHLMHIRHITGLYLLLTLLPVCLMSLAIVPEQRFAIAPMILIWILCVTCLIKLKLTLKTVSQNPPSVSF